jgi:hypothetical protein
MASTSTRIAALLLAGFTVTAVPALAQGRNGGGARNGGNRGGGEHRATSENRGNQNPGGGNYQNRSYVAPRGGAVVTPRGAVVVPRAVAPAYRSYGHPAYGYRSYAYRPYYGYRSYYHPYPYRPYGWRPGLGLNFYFGVPYAPGYPSDLYAPGAAYGYYSVVPGRSYGAVRIVDAPQNAQVYVDGSYAGVVDDYDGVFQHLNLEGGSHHIEVVVEGAEQPLAFDVNVEPGQTVTLHARF